MATGLGQPAARQQPVIRVVPQPVAIAPRHAETGGRNSRDAEPVLADVYGSAYDQPAWMRKRAVGDQLTDSSDASFDLLDVPAFLRRQADEAGLTQEDQGSCAGRSGRSRTGAIARFWPPVLG